MYGNSIQNLHPASSDFPTTIKYLSFHFDLPCDKYITGRYTLVKCDDYWRFSELLNVLSWWLSLISQHISCHDIVQVILLRNKFFSLLGALVAALKWCLSKWLFPSVSHSSVMISCPPAAQNHENMQEVYIYGSNRKTLKTRFADRSSRQQGGGGKVCLVCCWFVLLLFFFRGGVISFFGCFSLLLFVLCVGFFFFP